MVWTIKNRYGYMTYTITVPDRGIEGIEVEVFNFTEPGGVALSMYNTDEV